jgi:hypothetical protein
LIVEVGIQCLFYIYIIIIISAVSPSLETKPPAIAIASALTSPSNISPTSSGAFISSPNSSEQSQQQPTQPTPTQAQPQSQSQPQPQPTSVTNSVDSTVIQSQENTYIMKVILIQAFMRYYLARLLYKELYTKAHLLDALPPVTTTPLTHVSFFKFILFFSLFQI